MCGIFGLTLQKGSRRDFREIQRILERLVKLSESRGKEAAGLAITNGQQIDVLKSAQRGSVFIKSQDFKTLASKWFTENNNISISIIGHTRLVTNGSMEHHENNQPIIRDGIIGVHNGIIVNHKEIFERHSLARNSEVDTEALLALIARFKNESLGQSVSNSFKEIKGEASVAMLFENEPVMILATNNGSLYFSKIDSGYIFASERFILKELLGETGKITHLKPNSALIINLEENSALAFDFSSPPNYQAKRVKSKINDIRTKEISSFLSYKNKVGPEILTKYQAIFEENKKQISKLKRCTKCILPEAMPFIDFDQSGICNFCRYHIKFSRHPESELKSWADKIRGDGTKPDCIFPLSGGRDSSYGLHYVKNVLKLNPIAYSYDWGMVTDLGRRNQARMCGSLGVEHLWVSADIVQKRKNIRQNVAAWLKRPNLGTIPLFMAGDKQYFYFLNRLKKQVSSDIQIYCENPVEQTNFKYGFCGVRPKFDLEHVYQIGFLNKLKLAFFYLKEFLINPALINSSMKDTIGAYISTYFLPHDYFFLFNYVPWDENLIRDTLIREYDWELAPDTDTTWRIGDGTAPFYNYIYYTVAGFTENDTFRSNQIREGMITRDRALERVNEENKPRWESLEWYFNTIGLDMKKAIDTINSMEKLY